jgi:hypothetical protein
MRCRTRFSSLSPLAQEHAISCFRGGQFDDFQLHMVVGRSSLSRLRTGVPLVHRRDFDRVPVTACTFSANAPTWLLHH